MPELGANVMFRDEMLDNLGRNALRLCNYFFKASKKNIYKDEMTK